MPLPSWFRNIPKRLAPSRMLRSWLLFSASSITRSSWRAIAIAGVSFTLGSILILAGVGLTGYAQAVALQFGATLLLIVPLVVVQRILTTEFLQRTVDEAEDRIAVSLAAADGGNTSANISQTETAIDSQSSYLTALRDEIRQTGAIAEELGDGGLIMDVSGRGVSVIAKYLRTPVPSSTVAEAASIAEHRHMPVLLVSNSRLTNTAALRLNQRRHPTVIYLEWSPTDASNALRNALLQAAESAPGLPER